MTLVKPTNKPSNPNFSSGPCSKRPGWNIDVLKNAPTGRSHRSKECKTKLNEVIVKSKKVLGLPENYLLGIMTGSNTGAFNNLVSLFSKSSSATNFPTPIIL